MPIRRYERREPTHNWNEIRPRLKDPTQVHYEIVRPVILFGQTPKERAAETGVKRLLFLPLDAHYQTDDNYPINGGAECTMQHPDIKVAALLP
jgi:hypothetical protein